MVTAALENFLLTENNMCSLDVFIVIIIILIALIYVLPELFSIYFWKIHLSSGQFDFN